MLSDTLSLLDDFPPVDEAAWRELVDKDLKGAPFEKKLVTHTYEGINLQPCYHRATSGVMPDASGLPGVLPFTRGSELLGEAAGGWDIRTEHVHPDLATTNRAVLTDLERGATSIHLRLDLAGRHGLDPDDPAAVDLCSRDGIGITSVRDLDAILSGVQLDLISMGFEAGSSFLPMAGMYASLCRQRGHKFKSIRAAFNADPLALVARDGHLPMCLDSMYDRMADLARWTHAHMPLSTSVRVGSGPYHHAGATAAQDLAFSMATAVAYLRVLEAAGMSIPHSARQMLFSYSVGCNFFLAIAKLRAARRLWARILQATGENGSMPGMLMHVRTSKRVLTARDPWVNMLRNTVCCFAGAVAGAQIITSEPFDKAIGLSDDFANRIARNTQLILQEESQLHRVIDPAGGCWMLEHLTDELADKAWAIFQQIEAQGGMAEALTSGWIAQQIDSAFKPRLANLARRKDAITGVSEFPNLSEKPVVRHTPNLTAMRHDAVTRLQGTRPNPSQCVPLAALAVCARDDEPTGQATAHAIDAAQAGASLGQLAQAQRDGTTSITIAPLHPHPYAEPFEQLRDASDSYMAMTGVRPRVFLANLGSLAQHTARTSFTRNFFEAGGFEVVESPSTRDLDQLQQAFMQSGANIVVLCSSDSVYQELVDRAAPKLKYAGARTIVLAGMPGEHEATYRAAGVDRFIFMKCDVLGTLRELLAEEGVL